MFFTSAIMVPILALTIYDDSILSIEHMITILSVLSLLFLVCRLVKKYLYINVNLIYNQCDIYHFRSFVDDDKEIVCQESLMTAVLSEVHYLPDLWVGKAHTQLVSNQFSQFFPFKAVSCCMCKLYKYKLNIVRTLIYRIIC